MADDTFGIISLTVLVILFAYSMAGSFFEHKHVSYGIYKFHAIHETGFGILLGIAAGGLFYWLIYDTISKLTQFNHQFFFYILLPIIIFSGGYNLNKRRFFQNFLYIGIYGIIGTILTFFIMLGFTYLVNYHQLITEYHTGDILDFKLQDMMIFAATICASDQVAALTMIKPDKYPKLFSVVFGEGLINDAVSIIMFICIEMLVSGDGQFSLNTADVFKLIWLFFEEFVFSFIIGAAFGLATALLFKQFRFLTKSCIIEIVIIIYMGYASFAICELIELSGVIAVLVCGVVMAHYNFYNISQIGKISSQVILQSLSLICEQFIYAYLGISLWIIGEKGYFERPPGTLPEDHYVAISFSFFFYEMLICFGSRAISMVIMTTISQLFTGRKNYKLSFWELNIIWFAGLVRGSVAYALIAKLQPKKSPSDVGYAEEVEIIEVMITTTLFMVIVTTIVLGALMPCYIVYNLKFQEKYATQSQIGEGEPIKDSLMQNNLISGNFPGRGENITEESKKKSKIQQWIRRIDERFIKGWFIFNYQEQHKEIQKQKRYKKANQGILPKPTPAVSSNSNAGKPIPGISNLKSIPVQFLIEQNQVEDQDQGPRQTGQRVCIRSTLNTKFQGQQEIIFEVEGQREDQEDQPFMNSSADNSESEIEVEEEMAVTIPQHQ